MPLSGTSNSMENNSVYDDLAEVLTETERAHTLTGPGSLEQLNDILPKYKDVIVFHDKIGFEPCGAAEYFRNAAKKMTTRFWYVGYVGKALPIKDVQKVYAGITQNKKVDTANDLIVAVGGGTVIDLAKIFSIAYSNSVRGAVDVLNDKTLGNGVDTVLIPTTAGTGSEATSFAVVYKDKVKHSVDNQSLLPKYTVLDPLLLRSLPGQVLSATILDALAQAVESAWARGGTDQSRIYSKKAIQMIIKYMDLKGSQARKKKLSNLKSKKVSAPPPETVKPQFDTLERLSGFQVGSHLAGKAINISRTTLPHSISYPMTSHFGIPHGIAVFLTLPFVSALNYAVTPENVQDGMTVEQVRASFKLILESFGVRTVDRYVQALRLVMRELGIKQRLSDYGIKKENIPLLAANAITKGRSDNNPRKADSNLVQRILESVY